MGIIKFDFEIANNDIASVESVHYYAKLIENHINLPLESEQNIKRDDYECNSYTHPYLEWQKIIISTGIYNSKKYICLATNIPTIGYVWEASVYLIAKELINMGGGIIRDTWEDENLLFSFEDIEIFLKNYEISNACKYPYQIAKNREDFFEGYNI